MPTDDTPSTATLPPPPRKPLQEDCCGHDCAVCVFDLYDQEMRIWAKECEKLKKATVRQDFYTGKERSSSPPLEPDAYRDFIITAIIFLTTDVVEFHVRSKVQSTQLLSVGLGQHVVIRVTEENDISKDQSVFSRQLTPYEVDEDDASFKLMIKLKPNGRLASAVQRWKTGDEISLRGPFGSLLYKRNRFNKILMLSMGVGMAPLLSFVRKILDDEEEDTEIFFHHGSRFYEDICHKDKLDQWTSFWNFHAVFYLSGESPVRLAARKRYGETVYPSRLNSSYVEKICSAADGSEPFCDKDAAFIVGTPEFESTLAKVLMQNFQGQVFRFTNLLTPNGIRC